MVTLKRNKAFEQMIANFGPWNTWGRAQHIAYGLMRGVEYSRMEKYSNDNPHAWPIVRTLWQLGAWEEHPYAEGKFPPRACYDEVEKLVVWVPKPAREPAVEAAE